MARIKIPHLCHKPTTAYRPDGNCRACMVEIEGERTLAASCIREPSEGWLYSLKRIEQNHPEKWYWKCFFRINLR